MNKNFCPRPRRRPVVVVDFIASRVIKKTKGESCQQPLHHMAALLLRMRCR